MTGISDISLIKRASQNQERRAIIAPEGIFTYKELLDASSKIASCLLNGEEDLREMRVVFLTPPGFQYVAIQWGIWRAGGVVVPLSVLFPRYELEYLIKNADPAIVIAHADFEAKLRPIAEEQAEDFCLQRQCLTQNLLLLRRSMRIAAQ